MSKTVRVAAVQMEPHLANLDHNRRRILAHLSEAVREKAQLVVFPECATSGYGFDSLKEARRAAEPVPGPTSDVLVPVCVKRAIHVVVGILEQDADKIYNSALLIGPSGLVAVYRKTHLPFLGVDRFVDAGASLAVHDTAAGRLGLLICYDMRFPEPARVLALCGAEIIVHPTNWHVTSTDFPLFITKCRARENRVYVVSADRVGSESGTAYLGRSQIIDVMGYPLAEADDHSEAILYADLDLAEARRKRVVIEPGVFEMDAFGDRRPDIYEPLTER